MDEGVLKEERETLPKKRGKRVRAFTRKHSPIQRRNSVDSAYMCVFEREKESVRER